MRVAFLTFEIFSFGQYGGYGKLTRELANGLAEKGIEVFVIVPELPEKQRKLEFLDDNIIMLRTPRTIKKLSSLIFGGETKQIFEMVNADIFHSEAPSIETWIAQKHCPESKHIITFQDPRSWDEMASTGGLFSKIRWKMGDKIKRKAISGANSLFCQARFIIPKVKEMYGIQESPEFLPNPVHVPDRKMEKADDPTVCFLGRWDPHQKRPGMFLSLAEAFPEVNFVAMGEPQGLRSESEKEDMQRLREKYENSENIRITGFVSEKKKSEILKESWAMVNTSVRECLPVAFLESLAHETPIISGEDPDNLVSNFGIKTGYSRKDYIEGLERLLESDWRGLGKAGREYVEKNHEYWKVIDQHIHIYKDELDRS